MSRSPATWQGDTLLLQVLAMPRAARDEYVGEHDGRLKIRIKAPPVDGAANARLIRFLAKALGVRKSAVEIRGGLSGRRKSIAVCRPVRLPAWLPARRAGD